MKNVIKVGDKIVFLYDTSLLRGTCLKINKKSIKIDFKADGWLIDFTKLIKPERVAHINDTFSIVWNSSKGVNGSYRIDYITYPNENKDYSAWSQPYLYIREK